MNRCALGFSLRLVASHAELLEACAVRAQAYGRHMPEMGQQLAEPDALDLTPGTSVFVCRDKADGRAIGTMRIQSSSSGPLLMEHSVALPDWLGAATRAEITRLAVPVGADPLTRLCLWKASYLYCIANGMRWMVIGARNEALIRNYRRLGFVDVFGRDELIPLKHTGGVPHRILAFNAETAQCVWGKIHHPLYTFIFETEHDDLQPCMLPATTALQLAPLRRRNALAQSAA